MIQLTLRGFDAELERELRRTAKRDGLSLNQAALKLLRRGAGLSSNVSRPIGAALDGFVGSLTEEDAAEVERTVRQADKADLAFQRRARENQP